MAKIKISASQAFDLSDNVIAAISKRRHEIDLAEAARMISWRNRIRRLFRMKELSIPEGLLLVHKSQYLVSSWWADDAFVIAQRINDTSRFVMKHRHEPGYDQMVEIDSGELLTMARFVYGSEKIT